MNYCTLQEAYSVPAFDPASKSARKAARSCASNGSRATPADPYDAYSAENGRELAMAPPSYGREDFTNPVEKVTYSAMANDQKYYCNNYGVCSDVTGMKEGFENPKAPVAKKQKSPPSSCGPLQPPPYEYPMSDADKKRYAKAMSDALRQEQTATAPMKVEPRKVDMNQVSGYFDEDLESYLQTKDMKAAPALRELPKNESTALPYDPEESPFADALQRFKNNNMGAPVKESMSSWTPSTPPSGHQPRTDKVGMWMDLLLFVLIGVLIIFLCDQLVKLGMVLGMKNTVTMLSPLLSQLEKA